MLETISDYAAAIISVLATFAAVAATLHIVLNKRDTPSAIGWIGLSWLAPVIGVSLYLVFGINRIRRRAESLRKDFEHYRTTPPAEPIDADALEALLPERRKHLARLAALTDRVITRPLMPGNRVDPLFDGDELYPAMLQAIRAAEQTITLQTYIFDNDAWGRRFATALGEASGRGVDVRVLIDAAGLRYSLPSILPRLRKAGVEVGRFLPTLLPPHLMSVNLRNHRKIMVVDGRVGFTGGMNIRDAHVIAEGPSFPTKDLHFRIDGPVVSQLQEVFVNDWNFTRRQELRGAQWFPELEPAGEVIARGISDGPDHDLDKLQWAIQGAIASARESVRIVTPYFLPDDALIAALNVASLRGVRVDIVLPSTNNLPYVAWAAYGQLRPLLERGCRVWLTPPPFSHAKLMVVDRAWTLLGSANIDPRSLRLNFEFNLECYDDALAGQMDDWVDGRLDDAEELTLEKYDARPFWIQVRDGFFRLLGPYL